jgi:hypothetical protein
MGQTGASLEISVLDNNGSGWGKCEFIDHIEETGIAYHRVEQ